MRRTTLAAWAVACACGVPLGLWMIAPLPDAEATTGGSRPGPEAGAARPADAALPPLDLAAFSDVLWSPPVVERPPEVAVAAPPPPPAPAGPAPVLLAIVRGGAGAPSAALYDPAADQIVFVREGDLILGRSVSRITETTVELHGDRHLMRLVLIDGDGER